MMQSKLTHPLELPFYILAVITNVLILVIIYICGMLFDNLFNSSMGDEIVWFIFGSIPIIIATRIIIRSYVHTDGIRLSRTQFPQIYTIVEDISRQLKISRPPDIYLYTGDARKKVDSGNGFGKAYIFINSEACKFGEESVDGLAFLLGREFGHLQLNHYNPWNLLSVMYFMQIPLLGAALRRVRTYSCDRYGAYVSPNGIDGFLFLVAGRLVFKQVNLNDYLEQAAKHQRFWISAIELFKNLPSNKKRLDILYQTGFFNR